MVSSEDQGGHATDRRFTRSIVAAVLMALLLIGLDLSQRAAAVMTEPTPSNLEQLVSPMAMIAQSGLAIERSLSSKPMDAMPMAVELTLQTGDTLIALLARVGIVMSDAYAAVRALDGVFSPRDVRPGWTLQVTVQPQDPPRLATLQAITFQPTVERKIEVSRTDANDGDLFEAKSVPRPLRRVSNIASATIDDSLFNAAIGAGVPQDLLAETIALFSFEVDFQRDIRAGDAFELFYDTLDDASGETAKSGDIYYASLVLSGKEKRFYRFTPRSGNTDLFSPDGQSIRKALLQTPVDATRISSAFGMRRHPILGYSRMHRGVDFAARAGTPVRAAGDGVVVAAGRAGSYGNYMRLQHNAKYSTAYAHLTRFARGVTKGMRVKQGTVIGYVGATGRATGPHLHYEVMVDGRQVNPRGVRLPAGEKLAGDDLRAFKARLEEVEMMLAAHRPDAASRVASTASADTCVAPLPTASSLSAPNSAC